MIQQQFHAQATALALAAASNSSTPGAGIPSLPGGIPGLGSAPHLQLPGPPGLSGAGAGLPPGMLNYTSVLSSLASQYAPGIKEEGGSSVSKENASSPRANTNDLLATKNSSSSRSSTNGKSSKHRPSSTSSSNLSKPPKQSTAESDGERSESDLVIDTSVGGNQKHANGSNSVGSGLLLPNGIKSENADNITGSGSGTGNEITSATPPVSASNGGGSSSRSRRDRSPMSDKDSSQRGNSSSGIKKERNTPQPNKAITPITGGPSNVGTPQMQPGGPLGLPPGLAGGRLPPSAAFG